MNLKPPNSNVIVELQSLEETKTESGIILNTDLSQEENPHDVVKGKVIAAGLDCRYIKEGMEILFENRWANPFNLTTSESKLKILLEEKISGIIDFDKFEVTEQNKVSAKSAVPTEGLNDEQGTKEQ